MNTALLNYDVVMILVIIYCVCACVLCVCVLCGCYLIVESVIVRQC